MIRAIALACLGLCGLIASASGQTLEQIAAEREQKLAETLHRLREARETIKAEQLPLARELNALDAQAAELDREVAQIRRLRDSQSVELETLQSRIAGSQKEIDYVTLTLLPTYFASYDAALSPAERSDDGEAIRGYNLFLEKPDATDLEKLERALTLMTNSFDQMENLIGGRRFPGEALAPDGTIQSGQFVQVGPLVYFASEEAGIAGLIQPTRSFEARIAPLDGERAQAIATVARTGEGWLPVDPSLGDAIAVAQAKDTLAEHLVKGGVWVYPILLFALVATIVALVKTFQIFGVRHPAPTVIHDMVAALREGNRKEARHLAAAQPQPAREMLTAAVDHADQSTEMIEEVMYECMLTTQPMLERFLNLIALTAATSPLLGLLGTVTGIIKTFLLMTVFGAGDPRPLISGISEALITTELGLIVAIPALVLHAILSRKVAGIMARMERTAVSFVNSLSRTRPEKLEVV